jgi:hypothetical protein
VHCYPISASLARNLRRDRQGIGDPFAGKEDDQAGDGDGATGLSRHKAKQASLPSRLPLDRVFTEADPGAPYAVAYSQLYART